MTTPTGPHNHYEFGSQVVLQATFVDRDDAPTDPTTVTCRIRLPDETIEELEVTEVDEPGVWEAYFDTTQSGKHWYTFRGSGSLTARSERAFQVLEQHVSDVDS